MKYYIGSEQHFEDSVNGYYDRKEEEAKQFDNREQFPEPPSDNTQSIDMTAKDFFNGKGGALTLDFLHPTERDFLIDMIELYASGKVKNALKDNTQSIDKELAGKIWDAGQNRAWGENYNEFHPDDQVEITAPDKETFINSLNLDNTQIRDGWVRMEDMEKEYKRGFDDGVKYRDGQHKAYFTIES